MREPLPARVDRDGGPPPCVARLVGDIAIWRAAAGLSDSGTANCAINQHAESHPHLGTAGKAGGVQFKEILKLRVAAAGRRPVVRTPTAFKVGLPVAFASA